MKGLPRNITLQNNRLRILFTFFFYFSITASEAQLKISGTVLDKSKINYVEGVRVISTEGLMAFTDSLGRYSILTGMNDSLFFIYNNKPTQKFAVNKIDNPAQFDISLLIPVKSKYTVLKEVIVYSKTYKQDSAENRDTYSEIFAYRKPRVETSITPGGGVGMDVNELINMFRFRRNKRLKAFQERLEADEKERFIDNRFNKVFVRRITQLNGAQLDSFRLWYRPSYEFASEASEIDFNQSMLNSLYHYRKVTGTKAKKEEL